MKAILMSGCQDLLENKITHHYMPCVCGRMVMKEGQTSRQFPINGDYAYSESLP